MYEYKIIAVKVERTIHRGKDAHGREFGIDDRNVRNRTLEIYTPELFEDVEQQKKMYENARTSCFVNKSNLILLLEKEAVGFRAKGTFRNQEKN